MSDLPNIERELTLSQIHLLQGRKETVSGSHLAGARCSSVVRAFAHGAMGRQIDPSWGGPIELFLIPASAPRLV